MRATIRKIGNSKGIIIPASFLAESGLKDSVEMSIVDHSIVIRPIPNKLREDWFTGYNPIDDEDGWQGLVALTCEDEEWQW